MATEDPWDGVAGPPSVTRPIRAAEVVGALSIATDLGTGQPLEHALRTAVLAVRLGELAGASAEELADTYYVALLHASGCTSNGHEAAQLFGDDIAHRAAFFLVDPTNPAEVLEFYRSNVGPGRPPEVRADDGRGGARERRREGPRGVRADVRGGAALRGVARLGAEHPGGARVRLRALGRAGLPGRRRRRDPAADAPAARGAGHLPLPLRGGRRRGPRRHRAPVGRRLRAAARRARRAELRRAARRAGRDADVGAGARERAGSRRSGSSGDRIDAAFGAIAAITGLKSPWLREHSTGVAELAEAAAWRMGLAAGSVDPPAARRARARPRPRRRVECDLGEAGTARVRGVGARAAAPALHRARLRPVAGARPDRAPGRLAPRTPRRLRLSPRHARAGARPGGPHPRRRRLLQRHARGAAVQAGARRAGGGGGAAARGRGGTARPGRRRRGARAAGHRVGSDRASCPPA